MYFTEKYNENSKVNWDKMNSNTSTCKKLCILALKLIMTYLL